MSEKYLGNLIKNPFNTKFQMQNGDIEMSCFKVQ